MSLLLLLRSPAVAVVPSGNPALTLRLDMSGTAFGVAPAWTDQTASLLTGGDGQPVSITWGRQDETADVQPSTCSFTLDNADGRFTPGHSSAAAGWDVGSRVNVRVTVGGTTYDRFTGYVDSIEPTWPGGAPNWSTVTVSCTDILSRLGIGQPLKSLVVQEMLSDSPLFLFPLDEDATAKTPSTLVGSTSASIVNTKSTTAPAVFGGRTGGADPATGLTMTTSTVYAADTLPATGWLFSMCVRTSVVPVSSSVAIFSAVNSKTFNINGSQLPSVQAYIWPGYVGGLSGVMIVAYTDAAGVVTQVEPNVRIADGRVHQIALGLAADQKTPLVYVDGKQYTSAAAAAVIDLSSVNSIMFGAQLFIDSKTLSNTLDPLNGVVSLFAKYPATLTAARILSHYQAVSGQTFVERTDLRIQRLARYGGLTMSTATQGQQLVGYQNTVGVTITQALSTVAKTENGAIYIAGDETFVLQSSVERYDPTSTVTFSASSVDVEFTLRRDRQGFANEITVNRSSGSSQRVVNVASQASKGRFDAGSYDIASDTDYNAFLNAQWQVAERSVTRTRLPSLSLDLLSQNVAATVQAFLAARISTLLTITGLPAQVPSGQIRVFLEGCTETLGVNAWSMSLFTSPVPPSFGLTLRADATNTTRNLLDSGLLIPF